MSYAVWRSALTWFGARTCDRTRVTCGARGTSRVAAVTAASHSGVPAVSVSEV